MKLNPATLLTLLNKPITALSEIEFSAIAFLLDWNIIYFERFPDKLNFRIEHERTIVDVRMECMYDDMNMCQCTIGPPGFPEKLRGNANTLSMYTLVQQFRMYYCREYSITLWQADKGGYTRAELNEFTGILTSILF